MIQFESHRIELAGIYGMEHDDGVLEFYDQPCQVPLQYESKTGRPVGVLHTPDFLVLRQAAVGWEEWKSETELERLSKDMPNRYIRGGDGHWYCPPAEKHAATLGFYYRVRTDAGINWVLQRNLIFLDDYFRSYADGPAAEVESGVRNLVTQHPGISLADLLAHPTTVSADSVFAMIAAKKLFVDLNASALAEPRQCRVYPDEPTAAAYGATVASRASERILAPQPVRVKPGNGVQWDDRSWTILNVGTDQIAMVNEENQVVHVPTTAFEELIRSGRVQGVTKELSEGALSEEAQKRLLKASPADLEEANRRYGVIAPIGDRLVDCGVPDRTVRDWVAKYRAAQLLYGYGFLGLICHRLRRGNRTRRLPEESLALMEQVIVNQYETSTQKNVEAVHGALLKACTARGMIAPSLKTLRKTISTRDHYHQKRAREGRRAAYDLEPNFLELEMTTPRHGDRPFEVCHIDHTELDIECVSSRTGKGLGRPWATFLVDAFSRRLLAVYLSFDPPSYRSCMLILRLCVSRYGRLPQTLVVDGGREFRSIYFELLTALYQVNVKFRPPAKARFGSVCERLFGATNTRFVHNLIGNTQVMKNVRKVTKSVNPKNHATWDLAALHSRLCEWAFEVYDTIEHPALGQSPRSAFASGQSQTGERAQRYIPYDESFWMLTLPSTPKGTAKVLPRRGVKINHIFYWPDSSKAFSDPEVENAAVPVRYDPFDLGVAYAFVKGNWIRCISEYYKVLRGRTEREVMLATAELRKTRKLHGSGHDVTALRIAEFLESAEAEQVLLQQRLRDEELRPMLTVLTGGKGRVQTPGTVVNPSTEQKAAPNRNRVTDSELDEDLEPFPELR